MVTIYLNNPGLWLLRFALLASMAALWSSQVSARSGLPYGSEVPESPVLFLAGSDQPSVFPMDGGKVWSPSGFMLSRWLWTGYGRNEHPRSIHANIDPFLIADHVIEGQLIAMFDFDISGCRQYANRYPVRMHRAHGSHIPE